MMMWSIWLQVVIFYVISSLTSDIHEREDVPQLVHCCIEHDTKDEYLRQGTLISPQYITLNSNYIHGYNITKVTCILGAYNVSDYEPDQLWVDVPPENVIVHENYVGPKNISNNIALIKLPEPVETNEYIQTAKLPPKGHNAKNLVGTMITGISQVKEGTPAIRTVKIASNSLCRVIYGDTDRSNFCTLTEKSYWSENFFMKIGDNSRVLIGHSLYSNALNDTYGTMIRISCRIDYYLDWIYNHTNITQTY